jgi:hypothetical protein
MKTQEIVLRVTGWGPIPIWGERRRLLSAQKRGRQDLLRARGSVDRAGEAVEIQWTAQTTKFKAEDLAEVRKPVSQPMSDRWDQTNPVATILDRHLEDLTTGPIPQLDPLFTALQLALESQVDPQALKLLADFAFRRGRHDIPSDAPIPADLEARLESPTAKQAAKLIERAIREQKSSPSRIQITIDNIAREIENRTGKGSPDPSE